MAFRPTILIPAPSLYSAIVNAATILDLRAVEHRFACESDAVTIVILGPKAPEMTADDLHLVEEHPFLGSAIEQKIFKH